MDRSTSIDQCASTSVHLQLPCLLRYRCSSRQCLHTTIPLQAYRSSSEHMDFDHGRETKGDAGQETIPMRCLSAAIGPSPEGLWTLRSSSTRPFPPPDILHCPCRPFPSTRLDSLRFPQPSEYWFSFRSLLRSSWHATEEATTSPRLFPPSSNRCLPCVTFFPKFRNYWRCLRRIPR